MSRFYLTVLVPGQTPRDEISLALEELMAPYEGFDPCDEGLVEADQCRCGLVRARRIASWVANEVYPDATSSEHPERFVRWWFLRSATIKQQLRHRLARPDCQFCHGSGVYSSDFERPIKFDGVAYGGSYQTAWIRGQSRAVVPHEAPEPTLEDNLSTVREVLELYSPIAADNRLVFTHSLLTPDGDWYSIHDDGWFLSQAQREAFELEFLRRLRANFDCWAVGLECLV